LHQPPWSFGFDSQTRGTRENRAPPCVKVPGSSRVPAFDGRTSPHRPRLVVSRSTCPPLSPSPHENSFIIGTAVIHTHTQRTSLGTIHNGGSRAAKFGETILLISPNNTHTRFPADSEREREREREKEKERERLLGSILKGGLGRCPRTDSASPRYGLLPPPHLTE